MTKERFVEILREEQVQETFIDGLWMTRPKDDLNEERLRSVCKRSKAFRDKAHDLIIALERDQEIVH